MEVGWRCKKSRFVVKETGGIETMGLAPSDRKYDQIRKYDDIKRTALAGTK